MEAKTPSGRLIEIFSECGEIERRFDYPRTKTPREFWPSGVFILIDSLARIEIWREGRARAGRVR